MGYFEAYRERMKTNHEQLLKLADDVLAIRPDIEVYHHNNKKRYISSITFFDSENINHVGFHEVPYRWSGCGYDEFGKSHPGGENACMPFTTQDVLTTFKPVTKVLNFQPNNYFKSKEQYLKWCSYLIQYKP